MFESFTMKLISLVLPLALSVWNTNAAPLGDLVGTLPNLNFNPSFKQYSGFLQIANVLYLESPVGVGFSYSTDGNITTNDDITAADNHNALVDFFTTKFPELRGRDFYVTGESYAGVYVPTLSVLLIQDKINFPHFKGIAIGNPLLNYPLNVNALIPMLYYHNLVSEQSWWYLTNICCNNNPITCNYIDWLSKNNTACGNLVADIYMSPYNGLDPYDLYYSCYTNTNVLLNPTTPHGVFHKTLLRKTGLSQGTQFKKLLSKVGSEESVSRDTVPQCAHYNDTAMWMNLPATRKALNIPDFLPQWEDCNYALNEQYHTTYDDMTPQVQSIMGAGVRVLIYNGDVDTVCNAPSNQQFVENLGHKLIAKKTPWTYAKEFPAVAGFLSSYEGIDFLTIRGSGHFVPTSKPREALQMLYNFIHQRPYSNATGIDVTPAPLIPMGGYCNQPVLSGQYFGGPYTASQLCQHGSCVSSSSGAACVCSQGYSGPFCDRYTPNSAHSSVRLCALYPTTQTKANGIPTGCPQLYTCVPYQQECIASIDCAYPIGYCLPWMRLNRLPSNFQKKIVNFKNKNTDPKS